MSWEVKTDDRAARRMLEQVGRSPTSGRMAARMGGLAEQATRHVHPGWTSRTGRLAAGVRVLSDSVVGYRVGVRDSEVPYGHYVMKGTRTQAPRPATVDARTLATQGAAGVRGVIRQAG